MPTNPYSGLTLTEAMTDEALKPANNLSDLPTRATALSNLGLTATAAEVNALDGIATNYTVTIAAGAANVCTITVTAKDAAGATVVGLHEFILTTSSAASGAGISVVAYSGTIAAVTGTIINTLIAKHQFICQTDPTTGTWVGSLTDTAKTEGETFVVKKPLGGLCTVSAATVTASYGA